MPREIQQSNYLGMSRAPSQKTQSRAHLQKPDEAKKTEHYFRTTFAGQQVEEKLNRERAILRKGKHFEDLTAYSSKKPALKSEQQPETVTYSKQEIKAAKAKQKKVHKENFHNRTVEITYLRDVKSLRNSCEGIEQDIFDRFYLYDLDLEFDSEIQYEPENENTADFEEITKLELSESDFQQRFCTKTVTFIASLFEEPEEAELVIVASIRGAFGTKMQMQAMDLFGDRYHHKAMVSSGPKYNFENAYTQHVNQLYSLGREYDKDELELSLKKSNVDLRGIFAEYPNIPYNDMLPQEEIESIILDKSIELRTHLFNLFDTSNPRFKEQLETGVNLSKPSEEVEEQVSKIVLKVISKTFAEGLPLSKTRSALINALGNLYGPFILYCYKQLLKSDENLLCLPANQNPNDLMQGFIGSIKSRSSEHPSEKPEEPEYVEEHFETGYESYSSDYFDSLDDVTDAYSEKYNFV